MQVKRCGEQTAHGGHLHTWRERALRALRDQKGKCPSASCPGPAMDLSPRQDVWTHPKSKRTKDDKTQRNGNDQKGLGERPAAQGGRLAGEEHAETSAHPPGPRTDSALNPRLVRPQVASTAKPPLPKSRLGSARPQQTCWKAFWNVG